MRLYTFCNWYLNSVAQGIQPAHCIHDMFIKYLSATTSTQYKHLIDWAQNHKTMICLNGGNNAGVNDLYKQFDEHFKVLGLPYVYFREDMESLNGAMTCVAIVMPERIYEYAEKVVRGNHTELEETFTLSSLEKELAQLMAGYSLAR